MPDKRIKPCPCCGSRMKLRKWDRTYIKNVVRRCSYVYCPVCHLRGPRVVYDMNTTKEDKIATEEKAINLMNRRYDG